MSETNPEVHQAPAPRTAARKAGPGRFPLGPATPGATYVQKLDLSGPMRIASVRVLLAIRGKRANSTLDQMRVCDRARRVESVPPHLVGVRSF